ncbi:hypothetical protein NMG60_11023644 [Bertholletia excelsa]
MEAESRESSRSYYSVLGVAADSSDEEIRRGYRKLAMRWHPDKWTRSPALLGEAKHKFQQIQEAYSVLSDKDKRAMYDAGLYDPDEEVDEGFSDFLQEMMSLMADVRREGKVCSMEELQNMFAEMARGFECPDWSEFSQWSPFDSTQWGCGSLVQEDCSSSKDSSKWPPYHSTQWGCGSLVQEDCPSSKDSSKWPPYHSTQWDCGSLVCEERRSSKRARCETNAMPGRSSPFNMPGFGMYGMSHFCS